MRNFSLGESQKKTLDTNVQASVHPGLEILAEWIADAFLAETEIERESSLFNEITFSRDSKIIAGNIPDEIYESE